MESIEDDDLTDLDLDYVPQGLEVLAEEIRSDINLSKNIDEEVNPITNSLGKDEDLDVRSRKVYSFFSPFPHLE